MAYKQKGPNPDVNTFNIDGDPGSIEQTEIQHDEDQSIEQERGDDVITVPPDAHPEAPIEEPPGRDRPPVGDVDDSPKRITDE